MGVEGVETRVGDASIGTKRIEKKILYLSIEERAKYQGATILLSREWLSKCSAIELSS